MSNLYEKPWHVLNIDISNAIRADVDVNEKLFGEWKRGRIARLHTDQLKDIFTPEWLDYMKSLGVEVANVMVFKRAFPSPGDEIHIDLSASQHAAFALNFVVGEDQSDMVFYDPNDFKEMGYTQLATPVGTLYLSRSKEGVKEIARRCIGHTLTLVRVDIPHNIDVKADRLAISLRMPDSLNIDSWEKAVDLLRPYIVE